MANKYNFIDGPWKTGQHRVVFKCGARTIFVQVNQLEWLEAQRDYVLLHVGKETFLVRATMSRMQAELPRLFCRIHRSAIVNIDYMKEVRPGATGEPTVVLQDGTTLPLGRGYRERLYAALDIKPSAQSV
jgi:two-component system LytT family response regulator